MDKNIEGDKYLDYLSETLERRQNFTAASLYQVLTVDEQGG